MGAPTAAADERTPGFGSPGYRRYVLTALLFVYILNFVDRGLLAVVAPQLKPELGISDTAFGLLAGFGFALLFTVVGIPLAQFAETRHRVWIMSVCVALWSLMTALCGLSAAVTIGSLTIGGFWILLACRVGVGIGEAGCTPPANSLIADYYPPKSRAAAIGYYAMGVTLGGLLANLIGGPVTDAFGWRTAFIVLGLPGILVAIALRLTVKEAPRGHTDPPEAIRPPHATFGAGFRELASKTSFWTMTAACTLGVFGGQGIAAFQSLFLNRSFGLTAGQASLQINVPVGMASALGTLVTGWLAGRLAQKYPSAIAWLPGFGMILCVPFYLLAFSTHDLRICTAALCTGGFLKYGFTAAQFTISQAVVSARLRAVSTAIMMFVVNLLGTGLGPYFIGAVSDMLFKAQVAGLGAPGLARKACEGVARKALSGELQAVCAAAHPQSLQAAMMITSFVYLGAGLLFLVTCRWLRRDLVAK